MNINYSNTNNETIMIAEMSNNAHLLSKKIVRFNGPLNIEAIQEIIPKPENGGPTKRVPFKATQLGREMIQGSLTVPVNWCGGAINVKLIPTRFGKAAIPRNEPLKINFCQHYRRLNSNRFLVATLIWLLISIFIALYRVMHETARIRDEELDRLRHTYQVEGPEALIESLEESISFIQTTSDPEESKQPVEEINKLLLLTKEVEYHRQKQTLHQFAKQQVEKIAALKENETLTLTGGYFLEDGAYSPQLLTFSVRKDKNQKPQVTMQRCTSDPMALENRNDKEILYRVPIDTSENKDWCASFLLLAWNCQQKPADTLAPLDSDGFLRMEACQHWVGSIRVEVEPPEESHKDISGRFNAILQQCRIDATDQDKMAPATPKKDPWSLISRWIGQIIPNTHLHDKMLMMLDVVSHHLTIVHDHFSHLNVAERKYWREVMLSQFSQLQRLIAKEMGENATEIEALPEFQEIKKQMLSLFQNIEIDLLAESQQAQKEQHVLEESGITRCAIPIVTSDLNEDEVHSTNTFSPSAERVQNLAALKQALNRQDIDIQASWTLLEKAASELESLLNMQDWSQAYWLAGKILDCFPVPLRQLPIGANIWNQIPIADVEKWSKAISQITQGIWESKLKLGEGNIWPLERINLFNSRAVLIHLMRRQRKHLSDAYSAVHGSSRIKIWSPDDASSFVANCKMANLSLEQTLSLMLSDYPSNINFLINELKSEYYLPSPDAETDKKSADLLAFLEETSLGFYEKRSASLDVELRNGWGGYQSSSYDIYNLFRTCAAIADAWKGSGTLNEDDFYKCIDLADFAEDRPSLPIVFKAIRRHEVMTNCLLRLDEVVYPNFVASFTGKLIALAWFNNLTAQAKLAARGGPPGQVDREMRSGMLQMVRSRVEKMSRLDLKVGEYVVYYTTPPPQIIITAKGVLSSDPTSELMYRPDGLGLPPHLTTYKDAPRNLHRQATMMGVKPSGLTQTAVGEKSDKEVDPTVRAHAKTEADIVHDVFETPTARTPLDQIALESLRSISVHDKHLAFHTPFEALIYVSNHFDQLGKEETQRLVTAAILQPYALKHCWEKKPEFMESKLKELQEMVQHTLEIHQFHVAAFLWDIFNRLIEQHPNPAQIKDVDSSGKLAEEIIAKLMTAARKSTPWQKLLWSYLLDWFQKDCRRSSEIAAKIGTKRATEILFGYGCLKNNGADSGLPFIQKPLLDWFDYEVIPMMRQQGLSSLLDQALHLQTTNIGMVPLPAEITRSLDYIHIFGATVVDVYALPRDNPQEKLYQFKVNKNHFKIRYNIVLQKIYIYRKFLDHQAGTEDWYLYHKVEKPPQDNPTAKIIQERGLWIYPRMTYGKGFVPLNHIKEDASESDVLVAEVRSGEVTTLYSTSDQGKTKHFVVHDLDSRYAKQFPSIQSHHLILLQSEKSSCPTEIRFLEQHMRLVRQRNGSWIVPEGPHAGFIWIQNLHDLEVSAHCAKLLKKLEMFGKEVILPLKNGSSERLLMWPHRIDQTASVNRRGKSQPKFKKEDTIGLPVLIVDVIKDSAGNSYHTTNAIGWLQLSYLLQLSGDSKAAFLALHKAKLNRVMNKEEWNVFEVIAGSLNLIPHRTLREVSFKIKAKLAIAKMRLEQQKIMPIEENFDAILKEQKENGDLLVLYKKYRKLKTAVALTHTTPILDNRLLLTKQEDEEINAIRKKVVIDTSEVIEGGKIKYRFTSEFLQGMITTMLAHMAKPSATPPPLESLSLLNHQNIIPYFWHYWHQLYKSRNDNRSLLKLLEMAIIDPRTPIALQGSVHHARMFLVHAAAECAPLSMTELYDMRSSLPLGAPKSGGWLRMLWNALFVLKQERTVFNVLQKLETIQLGAKAREFISSGSSTTSSDPTNNDDEVTVPEKNNPFHTHKIRLALMELNTTLQRLEANMMAARSLKDKHKVLKDAGVEVNQLMNLAAVEADISRLQTQLNLTSADKLQFDPVSYPSHDSKEELLKLFQDSTYKPDWQLALDAFKPLMESDEAESKAEADKNPLHRMELAEAAEYRICFSSLKERLSNVKYYDLAEGFSKELLASLAKRSKKLEDLALEQHNAIIEWAKKSTLPLIQEKLQDVTLLGEQDLRESIFDLYQHGKLPDSSIAQTITLFLLYATEKQQMDKANKKLQDLATVTSTAVKEDIIKDIYNLIDAGTNYQRYGSTPPRFARKYFVMEYRHQIILRKAQTQWVEAIVADPVLLVQSIMGSGKTTVFMVLIMQLLAEENRLSPKGTKKLPVALVTEPLFNMNIASMDSATRKLFQQAAFNFDYSIDDPNNPLFLAQLYHRMLSGLVHNQYGITTVPRLAALEHQLSSLAMQLLKLKDKFCHLSLTDLESLVHDSTLKKVIALQEQKSWLIRTRSLLSQQRFADEGDAIFDITQEINLRLGTQGINPDIVTLTHRLMELLLINPAITDKDLLKLRSAILNSRYAAMPDKQITKALTALRTHLEKTPLSPSDVTHLESLLRIIPAFLKKSAGIDLGPREVDGCVVVPLQQRQETPNTQFGNEHELTFAQYLQYGCRGPTDKALKEILFEMQLREPEVYKTIVIDTCRWKQGKKTVSESESKEAVESIEEMDVIHVIAFLRTTAACGYRLNILKTYVINRLQLSKEQMRLSAQDIVRDTSCGIASGTLNPAALPEGCHVPENQRTREVEAETWLRIAMGARPVRVVPDKEMVKYVKARLADHNVKGLINPALNLGDVIELIQGLRSSEHGKNRDFIFINPDSKNRLPYILVAGASEPVPYKGIYNPERCFFYFDPSDSRGTDFQMPPGIYFMTPGPTTKQDSFCQAAWRCRDLGPRQQLELLLQQSIADRIRSTQAYVGTEISLYNLFKDIQTPTVETYGNLNYKQSRKAIEGFVVTVMRDQIFRESELVKNVGKPLSSNLLLPLLIETHLDLILIEAAQKKELIVQRQREMPETIEGAKLEDVQVVLNRTYDQAIKDLIDLKAEIATKIGLLRERFNILTTSQIKKTVPTPSSPPVVSETHTPIKSFSVMGAFQAGLSTIGKTFTRVASQLATKVAEEIAQRKGQIILSSIQSKFEKSVAGIQNKLDRDIERLQEKQKAFNAHFETQHKGTLPTKVPGSVSSSAGTSMVVLEQQQQHTQQTKVQMGGKKTKTSLDYIEPKYHSLMVPDVTTASYSALDKSEGDLIVASEVWFPHVPSGALTAPLLPVYMTTEVANIFKQGSLPLGILIDGIKLLAVSAGTSYNFCLIGRNDFYRTYERRKVIKSAVYVIDREPKKGSPLGLSELSSDIAKPELNDSMTICCCAWVRLMLGCNKLTTAETAALSSLLKSTPTFTDLLEQVRKQNPETATLMKQLHQQ